MHSVELTCSEIKVCLPCCFIDTCVSIANALELPVSNDLKRPVECLSLVTSDDKFWEPCTYLWILKQPSGFLACYHGNLSDIWKFCRGFGTSRKHPYFRDDHTDKALTPPEICSGLFMILNYICIYCRSCSCMLVVDCCVYSVFMFLIDLAWPTYKILLRISFKATLTYLFKAVRP